VHVFLRGSFRILLLYDVAEAIDLAKLGQMLGARAGPAKGAFPRRTPDYVRFERPPLVEPIECITTSTGEKAHCAMKYYAFGVVAVQNDVAFEGTWESLVAQATRWMEPYDLEPHSRELARQSLERIAAAVINPTKDWLQEEYLVINVQQIEDTGGERHPTAAELLSIHGPQIAQMIRGELAPLAPGTTEKLLEGHMSYYPTDLVVPGSSAAFVYDRSDDAAATSQVLEYAKVQLLEFRYYDALMTKLLSEIYAALERKRNFLFDRWSVPRDAQRFNTIRLDVMELTERVDNAIKFVSDIYYARLYELASARIGVPEYRNLVDEKLRTAGELYDSMIDQFHDSRSFVLEVAVAILAVLDVVLLFAGK
jgi:hypothetical protein